MAFNISYNPNPYALADAGMATGYAQYQKEMEAEMARRAAEQQRIAQAAEQLRMQGQMNAHNRGMDAAKFGEARRQFNVGAGQNQRDAMIGMQERAAADYLARQKLAEGMRQFDIGAGQNNRDAYLRQREGEAERRARRMLQEDTQQQQFDLLQADQAADFRKQEYAAKIEQQQQAAQAAAGLEQQELAANLQLRNKLTAVEPPKEIQEGLANGSMRYSPHQKQRMAEIQDAITRAQQDRRLSPSERAGFTARMQEEYTGLLNSPQNVPIDERPKKPPIYETEKDPITGENLYFTTDKDGGKHLFDPPERARAHEKEMKEIEQRAKDQAQETAAKTAKVTARREAVKAAADALTKEHLAAKPKLTDFKKIEKTPSTQPGVPWLEKEVPDLDGYKIALDQWKREKPTKEDVQAYAGMLLEEEPEPPPPTTFPPLGPPPAMPVPEMGTGEVGGYRDPNAPPEMMPPEMTGGEQPPPEMPPSIPGDMSQQPGGQPAPPPQALPPGYDPPIPPNADLETLPDDPNEPPSFETLPDDPNAPTEFQLLSQSEPIISMPKGRKVTLPGETQERFVYDSSTEDIDSFGLPEGTPIYDAKTGRRGRYTRG